MDILGKLFGSQDRLKAMRLFVSNPDSFFNSQAVAKRSKISLVAARRESALLSQIGFVKAKRREGWKLNPSFPYVGYLRGLLRMDILNRQREVTDRFANCGRVKLLLIAGLFIQSEDSRADLLLVGDKLKRAAVERVIKAIEAEVGRELVYAVFDTADFLYRLNAYDKFIRDILDYPHEKIIDRLNLSGYPHQ